MAEPALFARQQQTSALWLWSWTMRPMSGPSIPRAILLGRRRPHRLSTQAGLSFASRRQSHHGRTTCSLVVRHVRTAGLRRLSTDERGPRRRVNGNSLRHHRFPRLGRLRITSYCHRLQKQRDNPLSTHNAAQHQCATKAAGMISWRLAISTRTRRLLRHPLRGATSEMPTLLHSQVPGTRR